MTDETGALTEHRSYDAFGKRRNPVWGEPAPASFEQDISIGFTGHESDAELGLINMKGRLYDPNIGRFLTVDPLLGDLRSSQSLNTYSYVRNNPLNYTDPSGFQAAPPEGGGVRWEYYLWEDGSLETVITASPGGAPAAADEPGSAWELGISSPPSDMDPTGSDTEPAPEGPSGLWESLKQNPYLQVETGFLSGFLLGMVPFGGALEDGLDATGQMEDTTRQYRFGSGVGLMFAGGYTAFTGMNGEVLGGVTTASGVGAAIGVPAMAVSTTLVVGGVTNAGIGFRQTVNALRSPTETTSSSGTTPQAKSPPNPHGSRGGLKHQEAVKRRIEELKAEGHEHVGGGSKKEVVIEIKNGHKGSRRPDITTERPDGTIHHENVGRTNADGAPVARERLALDDVEGEKGVRPGFTGYTP